MITKPPEVIMLHEELMLGEEPILEENIFRNLFIKSFLNDWMSKNKIHDAKNDFILWHIAMLNAFMSRVLGEPQEVKLRREKVVLEEISGSIESQAQSVPLKDNKIGPFLQYNDLILLDTIF